MLSLRLTYVSQASLPQYGWPTGEVEHNAGLRGKHVPMCGFGNQQQQVLQALLHKSCRTTDSRNGLFVLFWRRSLSPSRLWTCLKEC